MSTERLTGKWAETYLGPQMFTCPTCKTEYEHDQGYAHFLTCGGTHERNRPADLHRVRQQDPQHL